MLFFAPVSCMELTKLRGSELDSIPCDSSINLITRASQIHLSIPCEGSGIAQVSLSAGNLEIGQILNSSQLVYLH